MVRSPKLRDGTVEVHVGNRAYFLSLAQIDELNTRFTDEIGGPDHDLPISAGRQPMNAEDYAQYCDLIQRHRNALQPQSYHRETKSEVLIDGKTGEPIYTNI